MLVLRVLMILSLCIMVDVHYLLYQSDDRQTLSAPFDCLYAVWNDDGISSDVPYVHNYYLIPYCRRPDDSEEQEQPAHSTDKNLAKQITFMELKQQGVTSEQLVSWSSPIDVIERYEMSNANSKDVFYNCSSPWFGSMCQYKFDNDASITFNDIVQATFANRSDILSNITTGTCYHFLDNCDRGPWPFCLDWHEVCDGKVDCIFGEDEQFV